MPNYVKRAGLQVDAQLADFIEGEALPGLDVRADRFWAGFAGMLAESMPKNRELLAVREALQTKIDAWHVVNGPIANKPDEYETFLREIGYLVDEPDDFEVSPGEVDPEISTICGPQLVVPASNARYALNAANARWGSLYDAFYGTDVIPRTGDMAPGSGYNPSRGTAVFLKVSQFLDQIFPLKDFSHGRALGYGLSDGKLVVKSASADSELADPGQLVGHSIDGDKLTLLLRHNGLHVELLIDGEHPIGATHPAALADVLVESALTTIQDCEDSVAAVDAEDKVGVYRNWLGLMNGQLEDSFEKGGKTVRRALNKDRTYTGIDGQPLTLKGRALLLVRNVGHLMTTDAVLDQDGEPIGEGLMDAVVTLLCAMHDQREQLNSRVGAIYVVKPKMHGPEEVQFACDIFGRVEEILGLPRNCVKIGIMDEERRTSANLKACVFAARERVFFINTGFLDRTGDEIHTSMSAGPVLRKDEIKSEKWIQSYEDRNVMIGLECGLSGKAQIGKGMWAIPDNMADMLKVKIGHPNSGANCAWVPSPTAATLHALHYHEVDVFEAQKRRHNEETPSLAALFSMPVLDPASLTTSDRRRELENNAQGILGYVVRWIDAGIGCSKVPDINDVGLMEDRATLRISSQHIANWLKHGIVTEEIVLDCFQRMAVVVDEQNKKTAGYKKMAGNLENSIAYRAALKLAMEGASQPSGYTEPILHAMRVEAKAVS